MKASRSAAPVPRPAEQAARREPLLAGIRAHFIDVDGLTPGEVVERIMETLASIGA